jgi:hypothetical protein
VTTAGARSGWTDAVRGKLARIGAAPTRAQLLAQIAFAAFVAIAVGVQGLAAATQPDFSVFWAAHRTTAPYLSAEYARLLGPGERYFPYPPTFLVLTLPLKWMSYPAAYLSWLALSASALMVALRRVTAPIVLFCPAVFLAGLNGQTSLLIGAALYAAASLSERQILAGVLYGLAACVKPQVGILLPIVLLAIGHWRTIAAALATVLLLVAASIVLSGLDLWGEWLASLPSYVKVNDLAFAHRYLALPGYWKIVALLLGSVAAWMAGRRGKVVDAAFVAIAAALLGSLHALDYDLAILAPFALSAALRANVFSSPLALAMFWPPGVASASALGALATTASQWRPRKR